MGCRQIQTAEGKIQLESFEHSSSPYTLGLNVYQKEFLNTIEIVRNTISLFTCASLDSKQLAMATILFYSGMRTEMVLIQVAFID
jgi:hypothetical protein